LNTFTQAFAEELSCGGVTINAICPETIATLEYLREFPDKASETLIPPAKIAALIFKLLDSNRNGEIIPVISPRSKMRYMFHDFGKYLKWLIKSS
jgi:NAD(P)-dependent dehydrogenase (short-subunit alcohol dehydrogenase family)